MTKGDQPDPLFAWIGIGGALAMAASDVVLLSVPGAGWDSDIASFSSLAHVSLWRLKYGPLLGWLSSFFICSGFWFVAQKLRHLQPRLAGIMFLSLSSMMVFGGAYHAGYYFAGHALYAGQQALYEAFIGQLKIMSYFGVPGLLAGTGIYVYLLAALPNKFPKWLKFTNLLALQAIFLALFSLLPAPVGGLIKPTFINLASIAFFWINLKVSEQ